MQGKWTKLYHEYFEEVKADLADELKARLKEATYETDEEIVVQYNIEVSRMMNHLFQDTTAAMPTQRSWFRRRLVEKYEQDQYRYKEDLRIDGFLEFTLPEIRREFDAHFKEADDRTKEKIYFDSDFARLPDYEAIVRLLASHDAYIDFFDHKFELKEKLIKTLEKEISLVASNHFNHLRPVDVYDFFHQLTQLNPQNKEAFLTEKQVYDLTNMICQNKPATDPIKMNLSPEQRTWIIRFIYVFYRYCKDTADSKGIREKYISILTSFIAQFDPEQGTKINAKNFAREQPDSPITIDQKYLRWKNA